jgi:2-polyprenyl-3-methyl-5-hydroxy-6-metoxy-1,4-benzoquinol methylase
MESSFRELVKAQHTDYLGALDRANLDIQQRLWADLEKIRQEYDRLIHTELRLIRQRAPALVPTTAATAPPEVPSATFDYGRFAERFRGTEEYVKRNIEFYKPFFAHCENVLDIGCGRGEFLSLMRDRGIAARGIDLSEESVAQCRQSGLNAEAADLFSYLATQAEQQFDGIFSSQVVEHLYPRRLPEMIRLCAASLRRGGILAIETPNPQCLAIFATHFYLDPTHTRPIPHPLMAFYMEEAGLGQIEVHELSPAVESMPELAELPEEFRKRFFGGLDYAIVGRKL